MMSVGRLMGHDRPMGSGDRSLRFFMTPDEAHSIVDALRQDRGDLIVSAISEPARGVAATDPLPSTAISASIGWPDLSDGDPSEVEANPGAHAWVRFSLPELDGAVLLLAGVD